MKQSIIKKMGLGLNDLEVKMLNRLTTERGFRASEVMRIGLRLLYRSEFKTRGRPAQGIGAVDPEEEAFRVPQVNYRATRKLSPKEYCREVLKGDVVEMNGVQYCKINDGATERYEPLESLKDKMI